MRKEEYSIELGRKFEDVILLSCIYSAGRDEEIYKKLDKTIDEILDIKKEHVKKIIMNVSNPISRTGAIKEMMEGGFNFHGIFDNLVHWIEELDIESIKKDAGIAATTPPKPSGGPILQPSSTKK